MIGHTGFLLTTRRLADGVEPPQRRRRPSKGFAGDTTAAGAAAQEGVLDASSALVIDDEEWTPEALGERAISDKKVRRVRRDVGQGPAIG